MPHLTAVRSPFPVAAILLAALLAPSSGPLRGEDRVEDGAVSATREFTLRVNGLERRYLVHGPPAAGDGAALPLVLIFHGGGGRARVTLESAGWGEMAEEAGFLAVLPEGTAPDPGRPGRFVGNPQTWNDGSKRTSIGAVQREVDDVAFVRALLEELAARWPIDRDRIYATGFSNGASMTFRLAREMSGTFAAVAPVAGADWMAGRMPERFVPVCYVLGDSDPLCPVEGGEIRIGQKSYGVKASVEETIERWVRLAGVPLEPTERRAGRGTRTVVYGPAEAPAVVLRVAVNHGHHWPGGETLLPRFLAGPNVATFDATRFVWEFFASHSRSPD